MYGAAKIPQQRLPLKKKTKKWREECIDAFINLSKFGLSERRSNLKALYDYYNGEVDETDYRYVIKPYGKSRENFPSKLRKLPNHQANHRLVARREIKKTIKLQRYCKERRQC